MDLATIQKYVPKLSNNLGVNDNLYDIDLDISCSPTNICEHGPTLDDNCTGKSYCIQCSVCSEC